MTIENIDQGLYRVIIPFEDITTTVYFYVCEDGAAIIDSATFASDVDLYILPALEQCGIPMDAVKYLLFSHKHLDHVGGMKRLAEVFPRAVVCTSFPVDLPYSVLADGERILGNLQAVHLPGHTSHSFGFYDGKTKTLLSADCLQLDGVGKYRNGIDDFDRYHASISKLKSMDIQRIVAAHGYVPLGSMAQGAPSVARYLTMCLEIAMAKRK